MDGDPAAAAAAAAAAAVGGGAALGVGVSARGASLRLFGRGAASVFLARNRPKRAKTPAMAQGFKARSALPIYFLTLILEVAEGGPRAELSGRMVRGDDARPGS